MEALEEAASRAFLRLRSRYFLRNYYSSYVTLLRIEVCLLIVDVDGLLLSLARELHNTLPAWFTIKPSRVQGHNSRVTQKADTDMQL